MKTTRYDTIVIGARCAGASTAMLLAREGLRVLLVDRAPPGTDTPSTHALMRGGVLQLHRWGNALGDAPRDEISSTPRSRRNPPGLPPHGNRCGTRGSSPRPAWHAPCHGAGT